jgi:transcriptional regulator with PAS, ATPase and Fis domain
MGMRLDSPIDYEEIYQELKKVLSTAESAVSAGDVTNHVLLDPGTPQMQTAWFLLVKSGTFKARLLQGIPPKFAGGMYKCREIELRGGILPDIVLPEEKPEQPVHPAAESGAAGDWIEYPGVRIYSRNEEFLKTVEQVKGCARYDINVLLLGETGTGKELLAKLIHACSSRCDGPFVEINCSGIPENLVESELFGHARGAFTGAAHERLGMFRTARGGTIFLDEIGDLPVSLQPKLLKVIEDKKLIPVGSDKTVSVDTRIIAATNRDLRKAVDTGEFRRDLYGRLNEYSVSVPPLRERGEDIIELAGVFLTGLNKKYGTKKGMTDEVLNYLRNYSWPGNVRELQNAVTNMYVNGQGKEIGTDQLPGDILAFFNPEQPLKQPVAGIPEEGINLKAILWDIEKGYYEEALKMADGNREQAAKLLGITGHAFRKACRERFNLTEKER